MSIRIEGNALTPEIYESVRKTADFQHFEQPDVKIAIENSLFTLVVFQEDKPVGIGRIVGDNRIAFLIKDVVVVPECQHQKIGQLIMENLLAYIQKNSCPCPYVVLMASKGTEEFYKKFGFVCRPIGSMGYGMIKPYEGKS